MKRCIARHLLIAKLAVIALVTLCLLQTPVHAQGMTGYIVIFPSVGLAPGESLRLTLFKPDGVPVRAQARIHHSGGVNIALGDGSVRVGGFQSFDIARSDIPVPGEAGTGRLQLRASFQITTAKARKKIGKLAFSMETISISDGTSNTVFFSEAIPSASAGGGGDDLLIGGNTRHFLIGIVPAQTLRITLLNPPSETQAQGTEINGHIKIFDAGGLPIAQSDELVIPSGEFRSFDFDRSALPVAGDPGTDRAQVRVKPFVDFRSGRLSPVLVSYELVDNSTGQTQVLSGDQCLVFFLGGTGN